MFEERFIQLVEENSGFEFYQAYRNDLDHIIWIKGSGASEKTESMPAGSTIKRIAEKAYLMQNESWVTRRTPKPIEDAHPHYHYVYGFGDKGLDVLVQYGVTIAYSDIKDVEKGFHLRYLYTGNDVDIL